MLIWPPERPGPSEPEKWVTIDGCRGMRLSTGGRAPDFTRSANIGVSCILGSGSASAKDGRQNARATAAVKNRRFISEPRYSAFAPDDFTNSAQRAASRLM